jgi:hypothetical protein
MASQNTYKVVCSKCGHYAYTENLPHSISDWDCPLCHTPKGTVRIQNFTKCGTCSQVFNSNESCPNCEKEPRTREYRMGKIGDWGKEPTVKENVVDAVEKGERILKNRVREELEAKEKREKNIERLLIEQNRLLKKLVKVGNKK